MNYNVNDIKDWFSFFNPEHFTDKDVDNFIEDLNNVIGFPEFSWEIGATKCCILPCGANYVIKIPFDGEMNWDYEERNYKFEFFYNGGGQEGWNYCALEDEYYADIIEGSGYEKFFLMSDCVIVNGWPIYIQQKVDICGECSTSVYPSDEAMRKLRAESNLRREVSFPDKWMAIGLENFNFNVKELDYFLGFLRDNFDDLHSGNIGYFNDQIVIIDYAGYNS